MIGVLNILWMEEPGQPSHMCHLQFRNAVMFHYHLSTTLGAGSAICSAEPSSFAAETWFSKRKFHGPWGGTFAAGESKALACTSCRTAICHTAGGIFGRLSQVWSKHQNGFQSQTCLEFARQKPTEKPTYIAPNITQNDDVCVATWVRRWDMWVHLWKHLKPHRCHLRSLLKTDEMTLKLLEIQPTSWL